MKKFNPYTYKRYNNEPVLRPYYSRGNIFIENLVEREIADLECKIQWYDTAKHQSIYYSDRERVEDKKRLLELQSLIISDQLVEAKLKELSAIKIRTDKIMNEEMKINFDRSINNSVNINGDNSAPLNIGNQDTKIKLESPSFFEKIGKLISKFWKWLSI